MKYRINNLRWLFAGLMVCVLAVVASPAAPAQNADHDKTHTIEVRDGMVWVNGEAVHELGDDGLRVGDMSSYRFFSGPDADFDIRSGTFSKYFADDSDHRPFVFELGGGPFFGALEDGFPSAEIMKLEHEARRLAQRIRSEDGDVVKLEGELDDTLARIFDSKMASRADRIEQLESRLRDLQDRLDQRESDRGAIIEQRKQELLGRSDRYDW